MNQDKKDKEVSYNDAWKDFLVIRPILYNLRYVISFDSNKIVNNIKVGILERREINGKQYHCDDSSIPDMPICYPETLVMSGFEENIIKPLLGKPLEEWKMKAIKGKHETTVKNITTRLGKARQAEVEKLVSEKHYWEALFSLHQIIEYRLRKVLMFKSIFINRDSSKKTILVDHVKENICDNIKTVRHLTNIAFIVGAINTKTRNKILKFNYERNAIAHDLLKEEIPSHRLKKLCRNGLKIMKTLAKCFSEIVPKPDFIEMKKFEVGSYLDEDKRVTLKKD